MNRDKLLQNQQLTSVEHIPPSSYVPSQINRFIQNHIKPIKKIYALPWKQKGLPKPTMVLIPTTKKASLIEETTVRRRNVIYAAAYANCRLFYIGEIWDQLNVRFDGHRSDIKFNPYRCKLPRYFPDQGCDFNKD